MTTETQLQLWSERISLWPLPVQTRQQIIEYATSLHEQGLPVIFEFTHLASVLSIEPQILADMVNRTDGFYRRYSMPKKRGGEREIAIPSPSLLDIQRWIYKEILIKAGLHSAAYGFVRDKNIIENARLHLGAKCLLKLDLTNFFPSITIDRVISVFRGFGFAPNVSYYLATMCCLNGSLPQGAATSPQLSNIISKRLDYRLSGLCKKCELTYSRYADDITISGHSISRGLVKIIRDVVASERFKLNEDKTVIVRGNKKKIVTGISISGESLTLPKAYKREIRKNIHYIRQNGIDFHMHEIGVNDPVYLDRLRGKVLFWLQVEPQNKFANNALQILDDEDKKL